MVKSIHALIIGDEILSGKRKDKHLSYLIKKLNENNLLLNSASYVGDNSNDIVKKIQEKALGESVLRSVTPGQQIVKIVHDELVTLMGESQTDIKVAGIPPSIVMICGLQGSGKTTFAGKLGNFLKQKGRRPMLVAADVYRPAAKKQLELLGNSVQLPVFSTDSNDAVQICRESIKAAREKSCDTLILDTAGRLHIDDAMMRELEQVKKDVKPHEILFVADGMTGQDAVNAAKQFLDRLDFDGVVLTKMDGDARGGAALSIREVTGRPIKFISAGEKLDAIDPFYPERMASRILGMGDVVSLVEKAQDAIDEESAIALEKKIRKNQFTLEDFYAQLQQIKKMGPLDQLLGMIPGVGKQLKNVSMDDNAFSRVEAIINSMTLDERRRPQIINGSRRKRIAGGSGTRVQDVNQLLKQFGQMKKMMKKLKNMKMPRGMAPGLPF